MPEHLVFLDPPNFGCLNQSYVELAASFVFGLDLLKEVVLVVVSTGFPQIIRNIASDIEIWLLICRKSQKRKALAS